MTNFIFRSKVWKSGAEGESCEYYRYYLLQREGFEVRDTATFHRNISLRPPPLLQWEGFEVRDTATFHRNISLRPTPSSLSCIFS